MGLRAYEPKTPVAADWQPAASAQAAAAASGAAPYRERAGPRSAAAAAQPADRLQVHRSLAAQPADAERRLLAWMEPGAVREAAPRKAVDLKLLRPAPRLQAARPRVAEAMPAMPAAGPRARSNPAFGFPDRSPSPPAMTTAPRRRRSDRARRAILPRTVEFPDRWSPVRPRLKRDWRVCRP